MSHSGRSQCLTIIDPWVSVGELLASSIAESNIIIVVSQTKWAPETSEFQSALNECLNSHLKNSMLANIVNPTPPIGGCR